MLLYSISDTGKIIKAAIKCDYLFKYYLRLNMILLIIMSIYEILDVVL